MVCILVTCLHIILKSGLVPIASLFVLFFGLYLKDCPFCSLLSYSKTPLPPPLALLLNKARKSTSEAQDKGGF